MKPSRAAERVEAAIPFKFRTYEISLYWNKHKIPSECRIQI